MAIEPDKFADLRLPAWLFLARLPLQAVFVAWVWFAALAGSPSLMSTAIPRRATHARKRQDREDDFPTYNGDREPRKNFSINPTIEILRILKMFRCSDVPMFVGTGSRWK
jgi:hypothetical protein